MQKPTTVIILLLCAIFLHRNTIAQNSQLDSLIFTQKGSPLVSSYSNYKKACLDTLSASSALIEQREKFMEYFNHAAFHDSLYNNQDLLRNIDEELHTLHLRVIFLEGESVGNICRIEISDTWKNLCRCPAEAIYSDILALDDEPNGSEYYYYDLSSYFRLLSKADTFLRAYPKHKYSEIVQTKYNETLLNLSDIHLALSKEDTLKLYAVHGFEFSYWPNAFEISHYMEMLKTYPGSYTPLLRSSVQDLCTFIKGQDSVYVLIRKNDPANDITKPGFKTYLVINITNPQYEGYSVLKYHYDKKRLLLFSKKLKGEIFKAVILNENSVRIIE